MTALMMIQIELSLLLLAAHFLREGMHLLVATFLVGVALVLVAQRWAMRVVQALLVLGTLEWIRAIYVFVGERVALDMPWKRLVIILGSVTLVTATSALLFETSRLRRHYRGDVAVVG